MRRSHPTKTCCACGGPRHRVAGEKPGDQRMCQYCWRSACTENRAPLSKRSLNVSAIWALTDDDLTNEDAAYERRMALGSARLLSAIIDARAAA